jgi:hypothetical protein
LTDNFIREVPNQTPAHVQTVNPILPSPGPDPFGLNKNNNHPTDTQTSARSEKIVVPPEALQVKKIISTTFEPTTKPRNRSSRSIAAIPNQNKEQTITIYARDFLSSFILFDNAFPNREQAVLAIKDSWIRSSRHVQGYNFQVPDENGDVISDTGIRMKQITFSTILPREARTNVSTFLIEVNLKLTIDSLPNAWATFAATLFRRPKVLLKG